MYVILSGDLAGGFFAYIEEENRGHSRAILIMPCPMKSMYIKESDIAIDLKYDNIVFVRKLPREVYDVCKANFVYYAKEAGIYVSR
jgi:hypothetical protein